ncbi:SUMO-interacting motif-containing protein 1 [Astyanax mexicanus]|uniref:SUMO interacting motifs containing 1 n=2 Tax=Astyanax mexicanus TaxID=7994 RepID=W5L618_ASTMX|nr:SUMO-interacting motif-containing protein 1 [Astyanax mexicanus]
MDGVISLSSDSGSEGDSDIEFVGSYSNEREDAVPFIRAELLAVTPVLIDITGHRFSPVKPRPRRKSRQEQTSTIEVIDLNNYHLPSNFFDTDAQQQRKSMAHTPTNAQNHCVDSAIQAVTKPSGNFPQSSCTLNLEKDVIYLDTVDNDRNELPVSISSDQDNSSRGKNSSLYSCSEDQPEIRAQEQSDRLQNVSTKNLTNNDVHEELQNTTNSQQKYSPAADHSTEQHKKHDKPMDSPQSWLDTAPSPFSLDSPYYCPSEIDDLIFSEESCVADNKGQLSATYSLTCVPQNEFLPSTSKEITDLHKKEHTQVQPNFTCKTLSTSGGASPTSSLPCAQPYSPTSTEILAGDSPDTSSSSPDLGIESLPNSPSSLSQMPSITERMLFSSKDYLESSSPSKFRSNSLDDKDKHDDGHSESQKDDRQHISLVQLKKLKHLIGGGGQAMPEDDEEEEEDDDYGQAEPLCRQSLSLVYSTIEESYPEGTLQLLSDLIQPRYYPPLDITSHLLKGILLDPHSTEVLALEAYNLLMRTQKYHPADVSTVPWDWDLLTSVMSEQDETTRIRSEVCCLLFQYVLQLLEDDFHFKLPLRLNLSIAKKMISCDQKFRQVRDVINWLLDAAKQSFCNSEDGKMQNSEQNCSLKMLLILQRMLLLAMEVDRTPTCSSNKLSEELCNSLNSTAPSRQLRLLLISTLESNLLRCKLLELLLDQACSQKRPLPMSFKLLLHFLQTCTLAPDPSDGIDRWRRWDELLQLLWMLMLSYEEVMTGHLRYSITERFTLIRAPMWTQNDQITRAAVKEAAESFLSRAEEDSGQALPSQIQESLSQLQNHLLSIRLK